MRNYSRLCRKITASGLAALLLVVGLPTPAAAQSCQGWNTAKFFETATVEQVRACLSAGEDPNEPDPQGLTALHRAARDTSDPAVIGVLLDAGTNPRVYSIAGRLPWDFAQKNKQIKGSDAHRRLMIMLAKKADWARVQAVPHNRKTVVWLFQDAAPRESRRDQGPLRLGDGRLHHAGAQGRANAHSAEVGRAQGSHAASDRQTMAGMGCSGGYRFICIRTGETSGSCNYTSPFQSRLLLSSARGRKGSTRSRENTGYCRRETRSPAARTTLSESQRNREAPTADGQLWPSLSRQHPGAGF